ncbi:MAG TPA: hypothetical protein VGM06_10530 [Polyangiaceae bacterium]|jgi:hypothetical protein
MTALEALLKAIEAADARLQKLEVKVGLREPTNGQALVKDAPARILGPWALRQSGEED